MKTVAEEIVQYGLDREEFYSFKAHLEAVYFSNPPGYTASPQGQADLHQHLTGRISQDRVEFVPWLKSILPLKGAKILEVGCGTGSSTVAMAEMGANVIGFDIDEASLSVASSRCRLYRQVVELRRQNASELSPSDIGAADAVIFFASIEHMTLDERIGSLSTVWENLRPGKLLIVVETPNRLWWYDYHSALLPFYLWLPDDLAVRYARFSPRVPLNGMFDSSASNKDIVKLARFGRSASFHEFELAIGSLKHLRVHSFNVWQRRALRSKARWVYKELVFEQFLALAGPKISRAFFERELNLALVKPS